jgi:hypothetical protein
MVRIETNEQRTLFGRKSPLRPVNVGASLPPKM